MREMNTSNARVILFPTQTVRQERKLEKLTAEQRLKLAVLQNILPDDPIWNVLFMSNRDQGALIDKIFSEIASELYHTSNV
ncbi:hypothetical protein D3C74_91220 [compost metagenome]